MPVKDQDKNGTKVQSKLSYVIVPLWLDLQSQLLSLSFEKANTLHWIRKRNDVQLIQYLILTQKYMSTFVKKVSQFFQAFNREVGEVTLFI